MKRRASIWIIALISLMLAMPGASPGAEEASQDEIRIFVDGEQLLFDVPPIITSERVLAPMRAVLEGLGYSLSWEPLTQTATGIYGNDITIVHSIGTDVVMVNGVPKTMDVASQAIDGRTMVPLRFFSEILDYEVEWRAEENAAYIFSGSTVSDYPAQNTARYFFPMAQGNSWDLSNGGLEDSGYKLNVLFASDPYYQCWAEVPGMSDDVVVYEWQSDAVRIIFSEMRAGADNMSDWASLDLIHQDGFTSNQNYIVLMAPVAAGTEWTDDFNTCTIVSADETVVTPAGTFAGCCKVERVSPGSDTVVFDYYAPGIGPVKRDYTIDGEAFFKSSLLEAYTVQ